MDLHPILKSQYAAALAMLRETIECCPPAVWEMPHHNQFWHIAYHTLFYTHLYVQESEQAFCAWDKHREESQFLGPVPWPPHHRPVVTEPYSKQELLEYWDLCAGLVHERLEGLDLEADSGFAWLPLNKAELQFYNIRHIQHHTGQLADRLRNQHALGLAWVGFKHVDPAPPQVS